MYVLLQLGCYQTLTGGSYHCVCPLTARKLNSIVTRLTVISTKTFIVRKLSYPITVCHFGKHKGHKIIVYRGVMLDNPSIVWRRLITNLRSVVKLLTVLCLSVLTGHLGISSNILIFLFFLELNFI